MQILRDYMEATSYEFSLFDVPLHYKFFKAATNDGKFDLRTIFNDTLWQSIVRKNP